MRSRDTSKHDGRFKRMQSCDHPEVQRTRRTGRRLRSMSMAGDDVLASMIYILSAALRQLTSFSRR